MNHDTRVLALAYELLANGDGAVPALDAVGDGPLTLLNLFAIRETAHYGDGSSCSGIEAMMRYSAISGERLTAVEGAFVAQVLPTGVIWGKDDDWDVLVLATYPSVEAFWSLLADPAYRQAFVHRRAAVSRQRVTAGIPL